MLGSTRVINRLYMNERSGMLVLVHQHSGVKELCHMDGEWVFAPDDFKIDAEFIMVMAWLEEL